MTASTSAAPDDLFGDIISYYGPEQMVQDGLLVDVSQLARAEGFRIPTYITKAAHLEVVQWTEEDAKREALQDEKGRLADVLVVAAFMIQVASHRDQDVQVVPFKVDRVRSASSKLRSKTVPLKACLEATPSGPIITISLPEED